MNVIAEEAIKKLGLKTEPHPSPYHLAWLNNKTKLLVSRQALIDLSQTSDKFLEGESLSDSVLPMRLAAKRAVSRYEGLLTPVGPREKLFRKLLTWIGLISPAYETPFQLANDSNASEPYLRCVSSFPGHLSH